MRCKLYLAPISPSELILQSGEAGGCLSYLRCNGISLKHKFVGKSSFQMCCLKTVIRFKSSVLVREFKALDTKKKGHAETIK